jgi:hypothetical protein
VDEPALVIEPLGSHHNRAQFSCNEPALDTYLQHQASQDVRRRVAQVFVAVGDSPERIAGYYSLSAASFDKAELPIELAKRLPRYPVPAAGLGRLAVVISDRGCPRNGGHVVIDSRVPAHDDLRVDVGETGDGVAHAVEAGKRERVQWGPQCA